MGRPVDDLDKLHWFLRGLGPTFTSFGASQLAMCPFPTFRDLVSAAKGFELYVNVVEVVPTQAAFYSTATRSSQQSHARSSPGGRGSPSSRGRGNAGSGCSQPSQGRGGGGRQPIRCQICRGVRHYATFCDQRYDGAPATSANLAEFFTTSCNIVAPVQSNWYLDTGASAHMTPSSSSLDSIEPYSGNNKVLVGNGDELSISHIGSCPLNTSLRLLDVLVVPGLQENLISISKLTRDYPVDVAFSDNSFLIQK